MTKIAKGRQGDLFEAARGGVLRKEFEDAMARIGAANRWAVFSGRLTRASRSIWTRIAAKQFLRSVGNQVRKCGTAAIGRRRSASA